MGCQPFPIDPAARSGQPLQEALAHTDPAVAIEHFLRAWYGVALPDLGDHGPVPQLLRQLQALNRSHPVIGADKHLVDTDDLSEDDDGFVTFLYENQWVWRAGYRAGDHDLEVHQNTATSPVMEATGISLSDYLVSTLISEAIIGAPCHAVTEVIDPTVADQVLRGFTPTASQTTVTAASYAGPTALIQAQFHADYCSIRIGAHTRAAIATSSVRELGGWRWFYGPPPEPDSTGMRVAWPPPSRRGHRPTPP